MPSNRIINLMTLRSLEINMELMEQICSRPGEIEQILLSHIIVQQEMRSPFPKQMDNVQKKRRKLHGSKEILIRFEIVQDLCGRLEIKVSVDTRTQRHYFATVS